MGFVLVVLLSFILISNTVILKNNFLSARISA